MPIVVVYSFHGYKLFYFLNISKFIDSPLHGHSGCFRFFAITNTDDVNILVPLSWCTYAEISLGYICLGIELLRYKEDMPSTLPESAKLFAKWLVPVFTHTSIS